MEKTLNWKFFKYLDSYHDEAYGWATKEYNKIKDKKEVVELDIDMISAAFVSIYSDFLHISMGYADGTTQYMLEDFYEKTDNVEKEIDMLSNYKSIIFGEIYSMYDSADNKDIGGTDIAIYESLLFSVAQEVDDEEGGTKFVDPIDQESYSFQKHLNVFNFVQNGFTY